METLSACLAGIEKDKQYTRLSVLKESGTCRTEKVTRDGVLYIRKYYPKKEQGANEYRLLSTLRHPALPMVHETYELADQFVVVEAFLEGCTLTEQICRSGPLDLPEATRLMLQLCEVVEYLHSQRPSIIHRDIKPDNILYACDGMIKLVDFDISRTYHPDKSSDTVFMGTVGYAPPEQFGFGQTDMRSDIYSIGMTLFYLTTGLQPNPNQMQLQSVPPALKEIVRKSTDFSPNARYQTVEQMAHDLEKARLLFDCPLPGAEASPSPAPQQNRSGQLQKHLLLIPVHLLSLFLTVGFLFIEPFRIPSGFGLQDNIISVLERMSVPIILIFPLYLIGFNLFRITDRIPFFRTKKGIKLFFLEIILVFLEFLVVRFLDLFHSTAFMQNFF